MYTYYFPQNVSQKWMPLFLVLAKSSPPPLEIIHSPPSNAIWVVPFTE